MNQPSALQSIRFRLGKFTYFIKFNYPSNPPRSWLIKQNKRNSQKLVLTWNRKVQKYVRETIKRMWDRTNKGYLFKWFFYYHVIELLLAEISPHSFVWERTRWRMIAYILCSSCCLPLGGKNTKLQRHCYSLIHLTISIAMHGCYKRIAISRIHYIRLEYTASCSLPLNEHYTVVSVNGSYTQLL